MMIWQEKLKIGNILLDVEKYLEDSDFLKHYPEEIENLLYDSEEYSGLQLLEYIIVCVFSSNNCIDSVEIKSCTYWSNLDLTNEKISEFVPYLWVQGL